jgi:Zn-dependent M28 family amino/carboxypeptidase
MTDQVSESRLEAHVTHLAGEIGERNVFHPEALADAARYIEEEWQSQGYGVVPVAYMAEGVESINLEVTRTGSRFPDEIILVGAHYDSVRGSPGANDNGTGVAALLELSRLFATSSPDRTLRFVAFVNEEPPFFYWGSMGSMVYAKAARKRGDDIRLAISLETIGYYSEEPGSQRYPPFFRFFYPDRGNFIAFVSNLRSRASMKRALRAFKAFSDLPTESVATFEFIPGINWSDHLSFWRQGYPAMMITDTAPYRYPHYHASSDTPDKIDYPSLARVTEGLGGMVRVLGEGDG